MDIGLIHREKEGREKIDVNMELWLKFSDKLD